MSTSDMHRPQRRRSLHPTDFQLDLMRDAPVNVTATKTVYQELDAAPPPYDTATSSQHSPTVMPSTGHATDTPLQPLHRQYIGFDARFCSTVPLELEMKQDLSISGGDWIVYSKSSGEAVMKCKGSWGPRNRVDFFTLGQFRNSRDGGAAPASGGRSASEAQLVLSMTCTPFSISNFQLFLPPVASFPSTSIPVATMKGHSPLSSLFHGNSASISTSSTFNITLSNTAASATSSTHSKPNLASPNPTSLNTAAPAPALTIDLLVRGAGLNDHTATLVKLDPRGREVVLARLKRDMWRAGGERVGIWVGEGVDWVFVVAIVVAMKLRRRRR